MLQEHYRQSGRAARIIAAGLCCAMLAACGDSGSDDDDDGADDSENNGEDLSNADPASLRFHEDLTTIYVAGVGEPDIARLEIEVVDADGASVTDPDYNNLRVRMTDGPFNAGGEPALTLVGSDLDGDEVATTKQGGDAWIEIATTDGTAAIYVHAGSMPGPVTLEAEVIESGGNALNPPIRAEAPKVAIASGPPHTINLTAPNSDALEDLENGFYRRQGAATVTDRWGNAVPDGTAISLYVIDSVIVSGVDSGATTEGSSALVDTTVPSGGFPNQEIERDGWRRAIETDDLVMSQNTTHKDRFRFVSEPPSVTDELPVNSAFTEDVTDLRYAVGASMIGAHIEGEVSDGARPGEARTDMGRAEFWLVYPANVDTILVGCFGEDSSGRYRDIDTRYEPRRSAQVWVGARSTASGARATTADRQNFCFSAIEPISITASREEFNIRAGESENVTVMVEDGGDEIPLPFFPVAGYATGDMDVEVENVDTGDDMLAEGSRTGEDGTLELEISVESGAASGDRATVVMMADQDEEVEFTVEVP